MLIIVGENADDFDQLRAELKDEHDPQSALEAELVKRLAGILWRLRRMPFFEAAILATTRAQVVKDMKERKECDRMLSYEKDEQDEGDADDEEMSDEERSQCIGRCLFRIGDEFGKLARHEASLMNAFTKTLQMLLLLQENRENRKDDPAMLEAVSLPAAA